MFHQLINFIFTQISSNTLISGGAVLGALGSVVYSLKGLPRQLEKLFWRFFSCSVEVSNYDPLYSHVRYWLSEHPHSKKSRTLVGSTLTEEDEYGDVESREVVLTLAPGNHFFKYKNKYLWFNLHREDDSKTISSGERPSPPKETITFTMLGRNQQIIRNLIEDIKKKGEEFSTSKAHIYNLDSGFWTKVSTVHKRPISSIILPGGVTESILDDVKEFLNSKEWYKDLGVPYHRGYLLYGIPGSGKSSLVTALSDELNMNLYVISLANKKVYDDSISKLLMDCKQNSIVLIEDIDAIFKGRKNISKSDLTFSGLLNALDGVCSKEGICIFMTTNHRENLDSALIRPGRVDLEYYFGYAVSSQIEGMIHRFYPSFNDLEVINKFIELCSGYDLTVAQLQKHFQKYKSSFNDSYNNIHELLESKVEEFPGVEDEVEETENEEKTIEDVKPILSSVGYSKFRLGSFSKYRKL